MKPGHVFWTEKRAQIGPHEPARNVSDKRSDLGTMQKRKAEDEMNTAEKLARFGHHPDPAIDFCIEVEALDGRLFNARHGVTKPGTKPETVEAVRDSIGRALDFNVGGDEGAVMAKAMLRALWDRAQ